MVRFSAPRTILIAMATDSSNALTRATELVAHLRAQLGARLIETHISWVLLDGQFAWKIKKPVQFTFLDFSELGTRRRLCEEEWRLNRRLAPQLYLDVVAIKGSPDAPMLTGEGPAIEYALRMKQFPDDALLSAQLAAGRLTHAHLVQFAQTLSGLHRAAPIANADSAFGSPQAVSRAAWHALDGLAQTAGAAEVAILRDWLADEAARLTPVWAARKAAGHVVEGHGDLHLANVVALSDGLTAFDCLEFDPDLRWIDACSDMAFLMMDLMAHQRDDLAFGFLNAYLDASGDHDGLPTLRYYLVYRAMVRALVGRLQGAQTRAQASGAAQPDYLGLAVQLTALPEPRLLITHGVSGSGKSHITQRLLGCTQAIRLRSDVERKRLFGLPALQASDGLVPGGVYSQASTQRTYASLRQRAEVALAAGFRVIVDATFLDATERDAFRQMAQAGHVPFTILVCQAPPAVLQARVQARHARGDDASEADTAVLDSQLRALQPLPLSEQAHAIYVDAATEPAIAEIAAQWLRAT
jgi:aminoglycoside phosphotransferase family enzyme/predicted kinase